jgi:hypothetical protein
VVIVLPSLPAVGAGVDVGAADDSTPGAVARVAVLEGAGPFVSEEAATAVAVAAMLLEAEEAGEAFPFWQLRSYSGALFKSEPMMPKEGEGVKGYASWRVYQ